MLRASFNQGVCAMVRFRLMTMFLAPLILATLTLPASAGIEVGDVVSVKKQSAELRRGFTVVATVRAGQELKVHKIDGKWIGTAVEVDGKLVGGWIEQDA